MISARFYSNQRIVLEHAPIPEPGQGEVLVRVAACCVCGSDLRTYHHGNPRVKEGAVLGHELSGTIVKIGAGVEKFSVDDRVAIGADIPCGSCQWCIGGNPNNCATNLAIGYQFSGGFSEYILLDKRVVSIGPIARIANGIDFAKATLAEPLACCINGYERLLPAMADFPREALSVVIFGAGPIGSMLALLAESYGLGQVVVLDPVEDRLAKLLELGIAVKGVRLDAQGDWIRQLDAVAPHPRLVFTACSTVDAQIAALRTVGPRTAINFFGGLPSTSAKLALDSNLIHYQQAFVTGSHGSTPKQFTAAMNWISQTTLPIEKLITHRFPLTSIEDAFKNSLNRTGLKTLIQPNL